jgi:hypothetical protein
MADLVLYNWTPWAATVQLNGIQTLPDGPIPGSQAQYGYFPFSARVPVDLSNDHGTSDSWGRTNAFRVAWNEVGAPNVFSDLQDPGSAANSDLLLWIFPDRVVISQLNRVLSDVRPDAFRSD